MNEIIKKIIEIDEKAVSVVSDAQNKKEHIEEIIEEKLNKINDEYKKRAQNKCEQIKNLEDSEATDKINKILENKEALAKKFDDIYDEKCDAWVNEIVDRILNI